VVSELILSARGLEFEAYYDRYFFYSFMEIPEFHSYKNSGCEIQLVAAELSECFKDG